MGNAPWERPSNDTIYITVKGNTVQDIPVTPYFSVRNVSFARNGNKVTARFTINATAYCQQTTYHNKERYNLFHNLLFLLEWILHNRRIVINYIIKQ